MARNRSEKGPLSDPEVYEYFRVYCAKDKRQRIVGGEYGRDPEWMQLANLRATLWSLMPEAKRKLVRKIKRPDRQAAFDAA